MIRRPPRSTRTYPPIPSPTLFRSSRCADRLKRSEHRATSYSHAWGDERVREERLEAPTEICTRTVQCEPCMAAATEPATTPPDPKPTELAPQIGRANV